MVRIVRWFVLLVGVMLLFSACAQPVAVMPKATQSVVVLDDQATPDLFFETQAEPGIHTECTLHHEESCEFTAQQPVTGLDDGVSQSEKPDNNVSELLLDFEIDFYQSNYGSESAWLSDAIDNGKPTVLVFWAGSCPVCRRELPEIQKAYEQYNDRVNFVGIDVGMFTNLGSHAEAQKLIDELALSFPLGAAMDFNVLPTYQITAVPTMLFLQPDGSILHKENSLLSLEAIVERVDALLDYSGS